MKPTVTGMFQMLNPETGQRSKSFVCTYDALIEQFRKALEQDRGGDYLIILVDDTSVKGENFEFSTAPLFKVETFVRLYDLAQVNKE